MRNVREKEEFFLAQTLRMVEEEGDLLAQTLRKVEKEGAS
jgi:hypothetical protein